MLAKSEFVDAYLIALTAVPFAQIPDSAARIAEQHKELAEIHLHQQH